MGEFNSGYTDKTTLTQTQVSEYIQRFRDFGVCGSALWRWSYIHDQNIPAFNLTKIVENRIQPGPHFKYLTETCNRFYKK